MTRRKSSQSYILIISSTSISAVNYAMHWNYDKWSIRIHLESPPIPLYGKVVILISPITNFLKVLFLKILVSFWRILKKVMSINTHLLHVHSSKIGIDRLLEITDKTKISVSKVSLRWVIIWYYDIRYYILIFCMIFHIM